MPKRVFDRTKRRIPCQLLIEDRRYTGLILDLSAGGFFVQTSADLTPGDALDLEMSLPGDSARITVQVRVARRQVVPARLRSVAQGGVGLRILVAPNALYGYIDALTSGLPYEGPSSPKGGKTAKQPKHAVTRGPATSEPPAPAAGSAPARPKKRYTATLREKKTGRSRTITLECDTRAQARAEALTQVGDGWEIERVLFV
jgi:Tfp pilus assembly protein PilZ